MDFTVVSLSGSKYCWAIYFSKPTDEEIEKAYQQISALCYSKIQNLHGNAKVIIQRLETELSFMKKTNSAFYFLLLKEIADFSKQNGCPFYLVEIGSLIDYLLEISTLNPLTPHYHCPSCKYFVEAVGTTCDGFDLPDKICPECGAIMTPDGHDCSEYIYWTSMRGNIESPGFTIHITDAVLKKLLSHLGNRFSQVQAHRRTYNRIDIIRSWRCEMLKQLSESTGAQYSDIPMTDKTIWKLVADEILATNNYNANECKTFSKEFSLSDLIRLEGYIESKYADQKCIENLEKDCCYTLADELFQKLVENGLTKENAARFAKYETLGFARTDTAATLKKYHIPYAICGNMDKILYLDVKSSCIRRIQYDYYFAWYRFHNNEKYNDIKSQFDKQFDD